jgi:hypothetical protein
MAKVRIEELRERVVWMRERAAQYELKGAKSASGIARHETWRHAYLVDPYLVGSSDEHVASRFRDVFVNQTELERTGHLGMLPLDGDNAFLRKFTHLLEEYGARGGVPREVVGEARKPLGRYFAQGNPVAMRIFRGHIDPTRPFLVKYGRREFLEPMLREGRMRICPASYYNAEDHNDAIRDDELTKSFFIPTHMERLRGVTHLDVLGRSIEIGEDDVVIPIVLPDYFLLSLCHQVHYRLPTDFGSDSALIIRDPRRFAHLVIAAFTAKRPGWKPLKGPVTYYDPYRDFAKHRALELTKHFGFAYQREIRIAFRYGDPGADGLSPVSLAIGPMHDYAELLSV